MLQNIKRRLAEMERVIRIRKATRVNWLADRMANLPAARPIRAELDELLRLIPAPPPTGDATIDATNVLRAAMGDPVHGKRVRELLCRLSDVVCAPPPAVDRGAEIAAMLDEYADVIAAQRGAETRNAYGESP